MKKVFADTSFLFAFHNKNDTNHFKAREANLDNMIIIISDYIFDEFLTLILVRGNKHSSVQAGLSLLKDEHICFIKVDDEVFDKAWKIYKSFTDKNWSFTDCTSFVLMKNLDIDTGLSFDEHWRQFGFQILP